MATTRNITQITAPRVDLIDPRSGLVSREWYRFFYNLYTITGGGLGITPVINGGTGVSTIPTNGQLLIGNGTGYTLNTLGFGVGISVTNAAGTITVTNTLPDQVVVLTGAGTTVVTGTYPNFTITSNDAYVGTVTSVGGTGTVNGITLTGTVTSSGNLTLGGTLSGVSLTTQVTGVLPVANGGNGSGSAYTVATLPIAGTQGRRAWVTDALAPVFLAAPTGGGIVVCPVFDNGTSWVVG
jgi:hypothetical protein